MSASTMTTATQGSTKHRWKFFRAGGFDQVRIESGADIANLDQLDQKLWVALACPTRGIEFDPKTLDLIDVDKDGRIRPPEIIAAARWATSLLKSPDELAAGRSALQLSAINDSTPEGRQILASAKQVLASLGKQGATEITAEDTADPVRIFAQTLFNGDGIIPADAIPDEPTRKAFLDIIACCGEEKDRSGKPGISQAKIDLFFTEAAGLDAWNKKAESGEVLPLGDKTAAGFGVFKAVKAKVDDYFARCRLAAFDPRALAAVNRSEAEYLPIATREMSLSAVEIAGFPLARIEAGKPLPLAEGLNPAWAAQVQALGATVVVPMMGERTALTEADWQTISARFALYDSWLAAKAGGVVEKLGLVRVRELLASNARETLTALIAKDKALEQEANGIAAVDKLVRYNRDLHHLLNNYVSFTYFYNRRSKAVFQAGTLYLDQRNCELCLRVEDAGKHASMAGLAGTYLAYCDCIRKSTGEKMQIVAAFTGGDSDNLMVGRNGIFYDRAGRDWDATITKIIDNPISIRQAAFAPYKKLVRMIEENVAKRAAAADAEANAKLAEAAKGVAEADKSKPAPAVKPKFDTGTLAAIGLVLTTLLGAIGGIFGKILELPVWQVPLAILGILLAISTPSVVMAWLKLRKRNLGPILDANGWAVNAKARINVPFGGSLTGVANLPPGAERSFEDPFAEQSNGKSWTIFAIILAIGLGIGWFVYKKNHADAAAGAKGSSGTNTVEKAKPN